MLRSDGATPEELTQQILAVAPILPGQESFAPKEVETVAPHQQQPAPNDLIDFGQEVPAAVAAPVSAPAQVPVTQAPIVPADLQYAQTNQGGQAQKDLEGMLSSTASATAGQSNGPLVDFHDDLRKDLPTADKYQVLHRQDTDTHSVDEFVDAQS